jgi:hypothetical protein
MIANKDCGVFSFAVGKQDHEEHNMRLKGASL